MQRCSRLPNEQYCSPYSSEANTAELTNCPFNAPLIDLRLKTRGIRRLTIDSAQHIRCLAAASVLLSSVKRLPRYVTDDFQGITWSPSFITGNKLLSTDLRQWKHINSHLEGARRSANGRALSVRKVRISCIPAGDRVNSI